VERNVKSRREFLKTSAAAALLGITIHRIDAAGIGPSHLSYDRFASLLGTEFTAFTEDGKAVKLVLESAKSKTIQPDFEEFSLRFRSTAAISLTQGTYRFKHKRIVGPFSIFIVPNTGGRGESYYEAVFNRFIG
jgi:hypothetical protein